MKRYFITGTDTTCGKTYATCQLLHYFISKNLKAEALKPVASGCERLGNELINEDVLSIQHYSNLSSEQINPWRYELPVSPHIAATAAGERLSIAKIADYCLNEQWNYLEYLLIEGAGGLMVPLNESETWLDMLKISKIPVILVVNIKLGCINHALLTESKLSHHHIVCEGWIANFSKESNDLIACENTHETLRQWLNMPYLGKIPYQKGLVIANNHLL